MKSILLIVTNNFMNDSRVFKEANSLSRAGYKVTVVGLHEKGLIEKEISNDFNIHRIKLRSRGLPKTYIFQLIKYIELGFKVIKNYKNVDVYHSNDLQPLLIGVIIKKIFNRNIKIVYDAHEYETERNGLSGFRKKMAKISEKTLIKNTDVNITVSSSISEEYSKLYKIKKPEVILNAPFYSKTIKKNYFRNEFKIPEKNLIFLYQGGLYKGRNIDMYIDIFSELKNVNLVIMGFGPLKEDILHKTKKVKNIHFQEGVDPAELINYTSSADIGLSIIENTCLSYYYSLPNKFFEYVMYGLPVIVNDIPELSSKVQEGNVGWVLDKLEKRELKEKIIYINEKVDLDIYKGNTEEFSKKYNWEQQEFLLLNLYSNLFKGKIK